MFRARTEIVFEGLNLTRTLNTLTQKYTVYNIERKGKTCRVTVKSRVAKQVVAYLEEKCYNVSKVTKLGTSFVADFFKRHFLLPVFLFLTIAVLAVSSGFCWKIEVVGDYDKTEVLQALKDCNVKVGASFRGFNVDSLENKLANRMDAMYAVVNRKGSALFVNVVKRKSADEPVNMHSRRDVVALCDGVVVNFLCEQGTAAVKTGDRVKKGDVLIYGYRSFNDGKTEDVYALGRVVIRTESSAFAEFNGTMTKTEETGRVFKTDAVVLFGKSYGKMPPFEAFRTEHTESKLFPLNITVQHIRYYETVEVTTQVSLEECLEQLKQQALQQATENADFTVKYTEYSVGNNGVWATVFGETEIN